MSVRFVPRVSGRERALLRAVSAGRCRFRGGCEPVLLIDGLACADSSASRHLIDARLVDPPDPTVDLAPVTLTAAGRSALAG